jgi:hypothetical protein
MLLIAVSLHASAFGQYNLLLQEDGAIAGDKLGWSVSGAGDINGDGTPDYIVGSPYADPSGLASAGSATVYSGANGAVLFQKYGSVSAEGLGYYTAGAGDINGDNKDDFIVGGQNLAFVFSGANGALLYQKGGGGPVAGAGDVNGDGRDDFIVSDFNQAYVYSGANGSLLYAKAGGTAVAGLGDINGDGRDDFIVTDQYADPGATNAGSAFVFSGANGALLYQKNGARGSDLFGSSAGAAGDVDGDGRPDFIIGARLADIDGLINSGAAYVYSGRTGNLIYQKSGGSSLQWGQAVSGAGDADGDGRADFLVASIWASPGGLTSAGSVYLFSGAGGALLQQFDGLVIYENFGYALSAVGDINGNGLSDFIIGGPNGSPGNRLNAGSAYIFGSGEPGGGGNDPCDPDILPPDLAVQDGKRIACEQVLEFDQPLATDNCDPDPTIHTLSTTEDPGPSPGEITYTRTWEAVDAAGNSSEPGSQVVIREACGGGSDPCDPDILSPDLLLQDNKRIACNQVLEFDRPMAADNCDPDPTIHTLSTTEDPGPSPGETTYTRTWEAVDATGNSSEPGSQVVIRESCSQGSVNFSQITGNDATCISFVNGTAGDLTDICYTTNRKSKIFKFVSKTVYFWVAVTAPSSSFIVDIVQTNDDPSVPLLDVAKRGVTVYGNCTDVGSGQSKNAGQASVRINGASAGEEFVIGVQYTTSSVGGTKVGSAPPTVHYDFAAEIGGVEVSADPDGLYLSFCDGNSLSRTASSDYELGNNYPNPFNPTTEISFSLPQTSTVSLEIYNSLGQRVVVLADGSYGAGQHTVEWDAGSVASGVYFYRLITEAGTFTKKMLLLK